MADRRDRDWLDPRFLVALGSLLVVLIGGFWTIARRVGEWSKESAEMKAQLTSISSDVRGTRDAMLVATTRTDANIKSMDDRIAKLENAVVIQQSAYNFNFTSRLAGAEARLGIKSPKQGE